MNKNKRQIGTDYDLWSNVYQQKKLIWIWNT